MTAILRYESGARVEAVLLAADNGKLRVAVKSDSDTTELVRRGSSWHVETGETVEIEAFVRIPGSTARCLDRASLILPQEAVQFCSRC